MCKLLSSCLLDEGCNVRTKLPQSFLPLCGNEIEAKRGKKKPRLQYNRNAHQQSRVGLPVQPPCIKATKSSGLKDAPILVQNHWPANNSVQHGETVAACKQDRIDRAPPPSFTILKNASEMKAEPSSAGVDGETPIRDCRCSQNIF